jgi:hypothetical protein
LYGIVSESAKFVKPNSGTGLSLARRGGRKGKDAWLHSLAKLKINVPNIT